MSVAQLLIPAIGLLLIATVIAFVVVVGLNATDALSTISPAGSDDIHHPTPLA